MRESLYEIITLLNETNEKKIYLVRDQLSHVLYVKKICPPIEDITIYEQMKQHPHPNMANVIDYEQRKDAFILIEEFINGTTLEYALSARNLSSLEIQQICSELFDVLIHLHHMTPPIIHRDIKPGNIMLEKGHVKLIDFEIARKYQEGKRRDTQIIGSVGYAAPEQYGFRQSDQRSDIYALGVLMKELMEQAQLESQYHALIKRCLEMEPSQRYQSVEQLKRDFDKCSGKKFTTQPVSAFSIPGFIKGESLVKKTGIFIVYGLCIILSMQMESKNQTSAIELFLLRAAFCIVLILVMWVPMNVGNILEVLPFYKSKYKVIRIMNGILVWMLASFVIVFILAMLSTILDNII